MNKKIPFFCLILISLAAGGAYSQDFGGVLSYTMELENLSADGAHIDFRSTPKISPWASIPLPNNLFLSLSASFSAVYETDQDWAHIPEVDRLELTWQPRPGIFVEAGRFEYADPLGIVASGSFDGAAVSLGIEKKRLSLGAFYTGLLYKKTANITMTGYDAFDYGDADAYWAPPRAFFSALYAMPGLFSWKDTLSVGFIGQFDFRDGENAKLHTQYLMAQYLISPLNALTLNAGGVFGFSEQEGADPRVNYAFTFQADWFLPTKMDDLFSLRLRYASGLADSSQAQGPFTPITTVSQSSIFSAPLSGLFAASMILTLRPLEQLSIVKETNILMRTDLATFSAEGLDPNSDSHMLGMELFFNVIWAPFSDLGLTLGGGFFLPFPNSAFVDDAPAKWLVSLGLIVSF
jgi:hypothetical protein